VAIEKSQSEEGIRVKAIEVQLPNSVRSMAAQHNRSGSQGSAIKPLKYESCFPKQRSGYD